MNPITSILDRHPALVIDGALATELERRGYDLKDDLWSAKILLEQPEAIKQLHFDYFKAGADCAITASYQATVDGFRKRGLNEREAIALIQKSVHLAMAACDEFWADETNRTERSKPFIAASVGPYGAFLADGSEYRGNYGLTEKELMDFHRPRMQALSEAGADFFACETIPSLIEAQALAKLLMEFPAVTAWFSFSAQNDRHISEGQPFGDCVHLLETHPQIAAIGINCTSPKHISSLIREGKMQTDKPILVYPNLGETYDAVTNDWDGHAVVESFGEEARVWYEAGARLIGGCCRTTPEDIRVIADWIRNLWGRTGVSALPTTWSRRMKSVRMIEAGKPLEAQDIPIPKISEKDILVRVRAAGICHSDAHYRAGRSTMGMMPITLGHEVAGVVEKIGSRVTNLSVGHRVCLHYNITCRDCYYCSTGHEQFCDSVKMLGHHVDGGYAEFIAVPARNAVPLPEEIPFEAGATLMCASATAFHALRKSRVRVGETVAIFGVGGLGLSAIQLARAMGAVEVYAVDIKQDKLELASEYNAIPIDASRTEAVEEIRKLTNGRGVNVALEMIGLKNTMEQAIDSLGYLGRAVMVGMNQQPISINTYRQVLGKEAEIIGSNDHHLDELHLLVDMARRKMLDTSRVVSQVIPLEADKINQRLDDLENFTSDVRAVIVPQEK